MADEMILMLNDDGVAHIYDETYDIVIHCESAEEQKEVEKRLMKMSWIPCSERLPGDGERVLATHLGGINPDRQVIEHVYEDGEFTFGWDMDMNIDSPTFGQRYMGKVVAWMPLPEPWKGENHETD